MRCDVLASDLPLCPIERLLDLFLLICSQMFWCVRCFSFYVLLQVGRLTLLRPVRIVRVEVRGAETLLSNFTFHLFQRVSRYQVRCLEVWLSCVQLCGNLQMLLASSWRKQKKPSLASGVRVDFGLNTLRSCLYLACWTVQVRSGMEPRPRRVFSTTSLKRRILEGPMNAVAVLLMLVVRHQQSS